jgi:hypothetical protein
MAPKASDLRRHRDHPKHPEGADHGPVRLDWIIVDLQHGPIDLTSAHHRDRRHALRALGPDRRQ